AFHSPDLKPLSLLPGSQLHIPLIPVLPDKNQANSKYTKHSFDRYHHFHATRQEHFDIDVPEYCELVAAFSSVDRQNCTNRPHDERAHYRAHIHPESLRG